MLYPFLDPPYRMRMNLRPLDPADWILIDDDFATNLAQKERLLAERHGEVFAALPPAEAGGHEVLERLAAHLARRFPNLYGLDGATLVRLADDRPFHLDQRAIHSLDLAGRLVQEDLCLLHDGVLVG